MKKAEIYEGTTEMEYAYDISGSRILKRSVRVNDVTDGTRYRYCFNPNDSAWNKTQRVLSFWYKGGFSPMYVCVTTSAGSKLIIYYCSNDTNYEDVSGNVCFYLGSGAAASVWQRFERNIEEDWESVSAATWSNTDGLLIRPNSTASYDFYIDHLRFSNSRTKTHNTLSGDRIGQIVSAKNYMSDSYGQPEDVWYSYDHNGNVVNLSDAAGDKTTEYAQDAFGNVLSSATTGAWASSFSGRHLTTKEYDDNVDFYYFWQRWYDPVLGRFISKANWPVYDEHPYVYAENSPIGFIDPNGNKSIRYDEYDELREIIDCFVKEKETCEKQGACFSFAECLCGKDGRVEQCMKEKGKWPLQHTTLEVKEEGALWTKHGYCQAETENMKCRFESDRPGSPTGDPEYSCKSKKK